MDEFLESVSCNVCGGKRTKPFLAVNGFRYQKCQNCDLVYQNPRPVFRELKRRYDHNYFEYELSNQDNFFHLMKLGLKDIDFDAVYNNDIQERRFLDIGCATGLLLNHMKQKGWRTQGVEICRSSAEYAITNFGINVFVGPLEDASFADNSFDVVHTSHVIEHVSDPKGMLLEIKRILKPHGSLVLTTPNVDGWQARAAKETWRSAIPDHIYLFSKKTMHLLLSLTGFTILKQISWGGIPIGKRPNFIKKPADRVAKLLNRGDVMLFHCTIPDGQYSNGSNQPESSFYR